MFPVVHYAENLVRVHDRDGNGILDEKEVNDYFPIIAPFIRLMANGKAESVSTQKQIYQYILNHGEPPDPSSWWTFIQIGWDKIKNQFQKKEATRYDILRIIAGLNSYGRRVRYQNIRQYFDANILTLEKSMAAGKRDVAEKLTDLFQCLPEAVNDFADLMKRNVRYIMARQKLGHANYITADMFTKRIQTLLANDPRFAARCLPF